MDKGLICRSNAVLQTLVCRFLLMLQLVCLYILHEFLISDFVGRGIQQEIKRVFKILLKGETKLKKKKHHLGIKVFLSYIDFCSPFWRICLLTFSMADYNLKMLLNHPNFIFFLFHYSFCFICNTFLFCVNQLWLTAVITILLKLYFVPVVLFLHRAPMLFVGRSAMLNQCHYGHRSHAWVQD